MNTCKTTHCTNKATRKQLCPACYMKDYRRKQESKPTHKEGIDEGRQQAVDAIHNLLKPHGGSCSLWDDEVFLELQGKTLSGPIT